MPTRSNIDPLKIPKLLPHVALTDVFHDPLRFRYRLIGTWITNLAERDVTGRWLDEELYGDGTEQMLWAFRACADNSEPLAVREKVQFADKDWVMVEALFLPISESGDVVDILLSGVDRVGPEVSRPSQGHSFVLDLSAGHHDR